MKRKIDIKGMTCKNCVRHVREALESIESISHVDISLEEGYAILEGECGDEVLIEMLGEAGYDVVKIQPC